MKTAIITGGAGGLGKAICVAAAAAGYKVGVADIDIEGAKSVAAALGAVALAMDVSDEASVTAALDTFGCIPDLLVNNAGKVDFGAMVDQSVARFRAVVETNLMGTYIPGWIVGRAMVRRGAGVIVNVSSITGITPGPNTGAYTATKAAIIKLTEQMALEWAPHGVRVNCVAPGFIDSGMSAAVYQDAEVRMVRSQAVPMRRLGTAEDIAGVVLFLASDAASYISGQTVIVDGGVSQSVLAQLSNRKG